MPHKTELHPDVVQHILKRRGKMHALDTLDRIEVLRGPLALSYGNAAGGVVAGYTELGDDPGGDASAWFGSDATRRASVRHDGVAADWRFLLCCAAT